MTLPAPGATYIPIRADLAPFKSDLQSAAQLANQSADQVTKSTGERMTKLGATLTKTLTPIAAGIALAFKKSFEEWDKGLDAIRVGTGATGKELESLEKSMKNVAGNVIQPMGEVGQVMADLATRTGLVGPELEDLATRFLNLKRIGQEVDVASITRLFGDWSVATEDQAETLDKLFRVSQASGVQINTLAQQMVQFGSPLRQLGLDFDFTAAMFARFEKEGVNIQTAMPGLRMALKNFAQAGREPAEALTETIAAIEAAATTADANTIAFETFGVRAGPDLAAAVREGRFDLQGLIDVMENGKDTIQKATEDTESFSDKLAKLRNRIVGIIGPFGEIGGLMAGAIASIGPLLFGIGSLTTALKGTAVAAGTARAAMFLLRAAMMALPWVAAIGAAVLLKNALEDVFAGRFLDSDLTEAPKKLREGADAFDELTNRVRAGEVSIDSFRDELESLEEQIGVTFDDEKIKETEAALNGLAADSARLDAVADHFNLVARAMALTGDEADKTQKRVKAFAELTKKEMKDWKESLVDDLGASSEAVKQLADDTEISTDDIKNALRSLIDAQVNFRRNWKEVFDVVGRDTDDLVNFLAQRLGIDAPKATALLADMSDKDIKRILGLYEDWQKEGGKTERLIKGNMGGAGQAGKDAGDAIKDGMDKAGKGMDGATRKAKKVVDVLEDILKFSVVDIAIQFRALNMPSPGKGDGFGDLSGSLLKVGQSLQQQGFHVGEHPSFGGVAPVHSPNSYHYQGRALDINWPGSDEPQVLNALAHSLRSSLGNSIKEMFWPWNDPVGGHSGHLHLAMDTGGWVRGPATVEIGNIRERVHFTPEAQSQPIFARGAFEGANFYGPEDFADKVSEAVNRRVGSF